MSRLLTGRNTAFSEDENVNPMDGVANLADVMLALVVGFMLALVVNWNIDIGAVAYANQADEVDREQALVIDIDDVEPLQEEAEQVDSDGMEKLGTVYFDEATGRYFIIAD